MADQYEVPGDITLDEKIEYLTNSLKPQLHDRWHFTKSIEVLKALETTYDPEADKTLKETNDAALADSKRRVLRCQILIAKFQEDLEPLLKEQKQRDETAKERADKLAAEEKAKLSTVVDNPIETKVPANGHIKEGELSNA